MAEQVTVLLVEDEPSFVEALVVGLKREGFRVDVAYDGAEALEKFSTIAAGPRAAGRHAAQGLRHRRLPHHPGRRVTHARSSWSRRRRARSTPLSASKSAPTTTSASRTVCASWWPVCGRYCAERLRPMKLPEEGEVLEAGDLRLDPERHEVYLRDQEVSLPLKEFELLELLMTNAGPRPHPGDPDRPGLGPPLRWRYQDPRCARQALAGADRGRPGPPAEDHDHHGGWATSSRPVGAASTEGSGRAVPAEVGVGRQSISGRLRSASAVSASGQR